MARVFGQFKQRLPPCLPEIIKVRDRVDLENLVHGLWEYDAP
jgi:hypothetical protein